jgi:hypothetical protein
MDGKSIMGILLLAAARGTVITLTATGPDEQAAVEALVQLVQSGFGEESWSVCKGLASRRESPSGRRWSRFSGCR